MDLVVNLPYSAFLSKYKKWLLAFRRQHKVSSQVQRGSVGLVRIPVPRRLEAVQRVNRLYAPKIVKLLTCVKGGHMEGHEPQFWMCECPVEEKYLHGFSCSLDLSLFLCYSSLPPCRLDSSAVKHSQHTEIFKKSCIGRKDICVVNKSDASGAEGSRGYYSPCGFHVGPGLNTNCISHNGNTSPLAQSCENDKLVTYNTDMNNNQEQV